MHVCSQMDLSWFSCPLWSQSEALAPHTSLSCRRALGYTNELAAWFIWDAGMKSFKSVLNIPRIPLQIVDIKYHTVASKNNEGNEAVSQTQKMFRGHFKVTEKPRIVNTDSFQSTLLLNQFGGLYITITHTTFHFYSFYF